MQPEAAWCMLESDDNPEPEGGIRLNGNGVSALETRDDRKDPEIEVVVECRKGQTVRTRIDRGTSEVVRRLPPGVAYPANYGYVEGTRAADGEAIDVFLLGEPVDPVVRVRGRIVAAIEFWDGRGEDEKLIAVPIRTGGAGCLSEGQASPVGDGAESLQSTLGRIRSFLEAYKPPEAPHRVGRILDSGAALSLLARARGLGEDRPPLPPGLGERPPL